MKTINGYSKANDLVVISYANEIGNTQSLTINSSSIDAIVQAVLDVLPVALAPIDYVKYVNGTFTITGELYPPILTDYADLSTERKLIVDNLKVKIFEVKGVNMTELSTKFGSNLVAINGVEYPYSDFISTEFANAITLANQLYNGL